jgi:hypothetical protein
VKYPSSEKVVTPPAESPKKDIQKSWTGAFTAKLKQVEYQGKEITLISTGKMV